MGVGERNRVTTISATDDVMFSDEINLTYVALVVLRLRSNIGVGYMCNVYCVGRKFVSPETCSWLSMVTSRKIRTVS